MQYALAAHDVTQALDGLLILKVSPGRELLDFGTGDYIPDAFLTDLPAISRLCQFEYWDRRLGFWLRWLCPDRADRGFDRKQQGLQTEPGLSGDGKDRCSGRRYTLKLGNEIISNRLVETL